MKRLLLVVLCTISVHAGLVLPRASGPIAIDGTLSESAWQTAVRIDTFYEYQRSDNGKPPVETIAYVLYDDHDLYIGVDCRDPEPQKIRAPYVDRDQVFGDQDNIAVLIDARGEGKVALQLRTNPRGIQADAVSNDSTGSEDFSPDFFYDTAARITTTGWVAEYRIPLSTLRFERREPQTWGIIILRNWPRDFRYTVSSSPLPRGSNCFICHEQLLTGITGLPSTQHLILAPYVSAQQSATPRDGLGSPLKNDDFESDVGMDLKWSPTPDSAIDATINPDFSHIESDVAQIAVNQRFAIFYPEKRPFFLEGSDLLETEIAAVYTRTITAPKWGVRGTGKRGDTTFTMLVTEDRGGGLLILPGTLESSFAPQPENSIDVIGRVRREMGRSAIGALLTARESGGDGGHNRVFGPDFEWRPNQEDVVTGELLISETQDRYTDGTSHGLALNYNHSTEKWDAGGGYQDFGDEFRADNGFVPQVGYRQLGGGGGYNIYPKNSFWIQIRPNGGFTYATDRGGEKITQDQNFGLALRGKRNIQLQAYLHVANEVFTGNGLIAQTYLEYAFSIDPSKRWPKFTLSGRVGDDIDYAASREARSAVANLGSIFRPTAKLQTELNWNTQILQDRDSGHRIYRAGVERAKVTYSFTAKSLLRVIAQYVETKYAGAPDTSDGSFTGSVLFSYKLNWQTVLFVGYGDDRVLDERANLQQADRTLFAKLSYAWQM